MTPYEKRQIEDGYVEDDLEDGHLETSLLKGLILLLGGYILWSGASAFWFEVPWEGWLVLSVLTGGVLLWLRSGLPKPRTRQLIFSGHELRDWQLQFQRRLDFRGILDGMIWALAVGMLASLVWVGLHRNWIVRIWAWGRMME